MSHAAAVDASPAHPTPPLPERRTPVARVTIALSSLAFAACAVAVAALVAAHALRPDLDPTWRPISDHALGPWGWVMTVAFVAWGLALASPAVALWPQVRSRTGRLGLGLIVLGAVGPIVAAVFPADPASAAGGATTTVGALHLAGAMIADAVAIGLTVLTVSWLRRPPAWPAPRALLVVATICLWAAVGWVTLALAHYAPDGRLGPDAPVGWANRALVAAHLLAAASLTLASVRARRSSFEHPGV